MTRSAALALMPTICSCAASISTAPSGLSSTGMPPIRSAEFSRSASTLAASLEAPCTESTYTEAPDTLRSAMESACTETKRSACAARARAMRSRSSTNSSRLRVSTARIPGSASMRSASARAMASVTSFSRVPPCPMAPGSTPPWPASTATITSRSPSPTAWGARTAFGPTAGRLAACRLAARFGPAACAMATVGSPSTTVSSRPGAPVLQMLRTGSGLRSSTTTRSVP